MAVSKTQYLLDTGIARTARAVCRGRVPDTLAEQDPLEESIAPIKRVVVVLPQLPVTAMKVVFVNRERRTTAYHNFPRCSTRSNRFQFFALFRYLHFSQSHAVHLVGELQHGLPGRVEDPKGSDDSLQERQIITNPKIGDGGGKVYRQGGGEKVIPPRSSDRVGMG